MKRLLTITICWLLTAGSVMAQYSNGSRVENIFGRDFFNAKGIGRTTIARGNQHFKESDIDHLDAWGSGVGFTRGFCLKDFHDYFLLVGANVVFSTSRPQTIYNVRDVTYDWYWERATARILAATARVPISVGWQFQHQQHPEFYIMPYAGINGTFHFWGKGRVMTENATGKKQWQNVDFLQSSMWHYDTASNLNVGTHLGLSVSWQHLTASLEYNVDILPLYKSKDPEASYRIRTSNLELSVGYTWRALKHDAKKKRNNGLIHKLLKRNKPEESEILI